jgi:outer membrane beta-barrel protein
VKRALLLLLASAALSARAASSETAPAQATKAAAELPQVGGQLAPMSTAPNALPPVTAQLFHVGGKLEVQPLLSISLGDPFYRTYAAGIRGEQHLSERWSLGVHVLAGASSIAAPIELCGDAPCYSPARDQLRSTPGQLQFMTGFELSFTPVYGKLSLIGERTIHFDAYVSIGPELLRERIAPDAIAPSVSRWDAGGRASIGERIFLTDRLVVRAGLSELVYGAKVRDRTEIERKLSVEGGVAWFFGAGR